VAVVAAVVVHQQHNRIRIPAELELRIRQTLKAAEGELEPRGKQSRAFEN
jgi:hypothetical protein